MMVTFLASLASHMGVSARHALTIALHVWMGQGPACSRTIRVRRVRYKGRVSYHVDLDVQAFRVRFPRPWS